MGLTAESNLREMIMPIEAGEERESVAPESEAGTEGILSHIYLTKQHLMEAGWTVTAIKRFLPAPIVEKRYSHLHGRYYAYLYSATVIMEALHRDDCRAYFSKLQTKRDKEVSDCDAIELSLLDATREASRCAHRWRDRANEAWNCGRRKYAGTCSQNKRYWYSLKERGIIAMHKQGLLRYAGVSPQGMGIYGYGDGGMQCLHSTLHPIGAERVPVADHPETLFVSAKKQEFRLRDVEYTLDTLSSDTTGYERSDAPRHGRSKVTCWNCGEEGHLTRNCNNEPDFQAA
jgi:Zinc knuckle